MKLRDRAELAIRRFHALETSSGGDPVIDYDCTLVPEDVEPFDDRRTALDVLVDLTRYADTGPVAAQLTAHATYLAALLGEDLGLDDYLIRTQGCQAQGWTEDYLQHRLDLARTALNQLGIAWTEQTRAELRGLDEQLATEDVADTIGRYAAEFEPQVRELVGSSAEFNLSIEDANTDEYWAYWLDGSGYDARLRINRTNASFTRGDAYRFALHEVLGHALQYASFTQHAELNEVPWPRLLAVHSNHQVLLEGFAQALPLIMRPDDPLLNAAARLDHYELLVRAELHMMINAGATRAECRERVHTRAPYFSEKEIARELHDRRDDPRLRSYLWAYPAGLDWFMNLWEEKPTLVPEVLRVAYQQPLSPNELHDLWPTGPRIGGNR